MLFNSRKNIEQQSLSWQKRNSQLYLLEDVNVNFGSIKALRNVHFQIDSGEVVFITGASGAGKTTLLKILSGDIEPTSGRVQRDSDLFVAQVFQDLRLMNKLSCEKNLELSYDPNLYSSRKEFDQEAMELCRILGVKDRLHLKINQANGGLKQKIAIIRALLGRPDILLADEPTSSLDYESAKKIFELLSIYNLKRGLSVVWASHNRELVQRFTGRIVHLDVGKLVYSGHACFI